MTESFKNRIAVISADRDMVTFFAWEARACGCPVEVFDRPPADLSGFDLAVLDARAGLCLPDAEGRCRIVVVGEPAKAEKRFFADLRWEWPISVEVVRAAYESRRECGDMPTHEMRVASAPTVYWLSREERTVFYRNRTVALTEREWQLLCALGEAQGQVVSIEALTACLSCDDPNVVKVHLCHLRKKLEEPFGARIVETVRNRGYRLQVSWVAWQDRK